MMKNGTRLVAHIVYRFGHGGLENGLVNLVNQMRERGHDDRYRHAIVCITDYTDFRERLRDERVQLFCLNKREGKDPGYYGRLLKLLRRLKPDIVHSRNLPALECAVMARCSGVPVVIHGEHGWDVHDLKGTVNRYRWIRRLSQPFIHRFVALSVHIEQWLVRDVGIQQEKIIRICNGVDTDRFHPDPSDNDGKVIRIGYVGRLEAVKNPGLLIDAYCLLLQRHPEMRASTQLELIGDGSLRSSLESKARESGIVSNVVFHGMCENVPEILRELDIYVLPSLNEGISNSILEAMASGLPIVATRVGGNSELVEEGVNGFLVESEDREAMAERLYRYCTDARLRCQHAKASRRRAEENFSISSMVEQYVSLYDELLSGNRLTGERG